MALDGTNCGIRGFVPADFAIVKSGLYASMMMTGERECVLSDFFDGQRNDIKIEPEAIQLLGSLGDRSKVVAMPAGIMHYTQANEQMMTATVANFLNRRKVYQDLSLLMADVAWCIERYEKNGAHEGRGHTLAQGQGQYNIFFLEDENYLIPVGLEVGVRTFEGQKLSCFRLFVPYHLAPIPAGSRVFWFRPFATSNEEEIHA